MRLLLEPEGRYKSLVAAPARPPFLHCPALGCYPCRFRRLRAHLLRILRCKSTLEVDDTAQRARPTRNANAVRRADSHSVIRLLSARLCWFDCTGFMGFGVVMRTAGTMRIASVHDSRLTPDSGPAAARNVATSTARFATWWMLCCSSAGGGGVCDDTKTPQLAAKNR